MGKKEKGKPNPLGEVSRDYTINLHKAVHKETFKRKAPRAVSHIVRFGKKLNFYAKELLFVKIKYVDLIKIKQQLVELQNLRRIQKQRNNINLIITDDVRVDPQLNEAIWARGIRNLPRRIRVRLQRKKKEEDDGKGKYYTLAQYVPVDSFDNLKTEITKQ